MILFICFLNLGNDVESFKIHDDSIIKFIDPPSQVKRRKTSFGKTKKTPNYFGGFRVVNRQERQEMAAVGTLLYLEDWATMNDWTLGIYDGQNMVRWWCALNWCNSGLKDFLQCFFKSNLAEKTRLFCLVFLHSSLIFFRHEYIAVLSMSHRI